MEPATIIKYSILIIDAVLLLGLLAYTIARWRSPEYSNPTGIMFLFFAAASAFAYWQSIGFP